MVPKISVIMSVYNCEDYLAESIESILNQTFRDFEFLIADDKSTDKSYQIVKKYAQSDERIRVFRNDQNRGLAKTLNFLIKESKGEYIARMDGDDISRTDRLQIQMTEASNNQHVDLFFSRSILIDHLGNTICKSWSPKLNLILKWMPYRSMIPHPSVLVKRSTLLEMKGYIENFPRAEDWELWNRMIKSNANFFYINKELIKYRMNLNNKRLYPRSSRGYKMAKICISNKQKLAAFKYLNNMSLKERMKIVVFLFVPHFVIVRYGILKIKLNPEILLRKINNY